MRYFDSITFLRRDLKMRIYIYFTSISEGFPFLKLFLKSIVFFKTYLCIKMNRKINLEDANWCEIFRQIKKISGLFWFATKGKSEYLISKSRNLFYWQISLSPYLAVPRSCSCASARTHFSILHLHILIYIDTECFILIMYIEGELK